MEAFRNAIRLNNHGAYHIECGNFAGAVHSFQWAIVAVKESIAQQQMSTTNGIAVNPNTTNTTGRNDNTNSFNTPMNHPSATSTPSTTTVCRCCETNIDIGTDETVSQSSSSSSSSHHNVTKSTTIAVITDDNAPISTTARVMVVPTYQLPTSYIPPNGLDDGIGYIFSRPLLFSDDDTTTIQNIGHMNSMVVSSISTYIFFNFALSCHLAVRHTGNMNFASRALGLYELSLQLIDATTTTIEHRSSHPLSSHGSTTMMSLVLFKCLVYNNLAQLQYEQFCDYPASQIYVEAMQHVLLNTRNDHHRIFNTYLDEKEVHEMILNMIYLKSPTMARAA